MNPNTRGKDMFYVNRFDTIMAFLILEIAALMCFGIGGFLGISVLQILAMFLAIISIPFIQNCYGNGFVSRNWKTLVPLWALILILGYSAFFFRAYGGFSLDGILYPTLEVMGLFGMFTLGIAAASIPVLKKEYILYAVLGALALYCVITGLYSLIRYGFFYSAIHKGMFYYYQGCFFPVDTETKMLLGFEMTEVSLHYGCIPAIILGSSGVSLFNVSPKKQRQKFVILSVFALIGIVFCLVIPYLPGLVLFLVTYALAFLYRLYRKQCGKSEAFATRGATVFKVVYFVLIGVIVIGSLFLLLEHRLGVYTKLLQAIFHRVPGFFQDLFDAVNDAVYNGEAELGKLNMVSLLFGHMPQYSFNYLHFTRFFEINVIWQNGFVGFGLLAYAVFFYLRNSARYLREATEEDRYFRGSVIAMMGAFFVYISLFADERPLVHGQNYLFTTQSNYFFFLFFLMGLTLRLNKPKEDPAHE